jgi:hypothetical protein
MRSADEAPANAGADVDLQSAYAPSTADVGDRGRRTDRRRHVPTAAIDVGR